MAVMMVFLGQLTELMDNNEQTVEAAMVMEVKVSLIKLVRNKLITLVDLKGPLILNKMDVNLGHANIARIIK